MRKYASVLALLVGFALAMAMHGVNRVEAPRAGPALPELAGIGAGAGVTIGDAWPASADLAGLQTGCAKACTRSDYRPLAPWEAQPPLPQVAGDLSLTWPGRQDNGQRLQTGAVQPAALARLQATPMQFAAEPLAMPTRETSLNDGRWLKLAPTPEPQSWALFITGMLMIGRQLRRRNPAYLATL